MHSQDEVALPDRLPDSTGTGSTTTVRWHHALHDSRRLSSGQIIAIARNAGIGDLPMSDDCAYQVFTDSQVSQ